MTIDLSDLQIEGAGADKVKGAIEKAAQAVEALALNIYANPHITLVRDPDKNPIGFSVDPNNVHAAPGVSSIKDTIQYVHHSLISPTMARVFAHQPTLKIGAPSVLPMKEYSADTKLHVLDGYKITGFKIPLNEPLTEAISDSALKRLSTFTAAIKRYTTQFPHKFAEATAAYETRSLELQKQAIIT